MYVYTSVYYIAISMGYQQLRNPGQDIQAFALPLLHLLCSQSTDHAFGRHRPKHDLACVFPQTRLPRPSRPRLCVADSRHCPRALHSCGSADDTPQHTQLPHGAGTSTPWHPQQRMHATAPINHITIPPTHAGAGKMALGRGEDLLVSCVPRWYRQERHEHENRPARQCFASGTMYIEHDTVAHSYITPQRPAGHAGAETYHCRPGTTPPGLSGCGHDGPGKYGEVATAHSHIGPCCVPAVECGYTTAGPTGWRRP